jgi:uncharacterized protein
VAIDYRGTTALITGASSGLGVHFAHQLAARGANVVLVARRLDRLESLASIVREKHGVTATVIASDLAAEGAITRLVAELDAQKVSISTLVNNAGFGTRDRFENIDPARVHEEVSLNVTALVDLTRALWPQLLSNGRGALITLASTAAYQPVPFMAVYGATKAFVLSFTEALWFEAQGTGLGVLALSPGATRTEFFDVAGEGARIGNFREPEGVVSLALATLDRRNPPPSIIDGGRNRFLALSGRLVSRRMLTTVAGRLASRNPV